MAPMTATLDRAAPPSADPIHLPPEVHEYLSPRKRVTYYFDGDPRQGRSK